MPLSLLQNFDLSTVLRERDLSFLVIYTTIRRLRVSYNGTTFTNDADTLYFRGRASMGNFLLHNACLKMVSCGGFIAHTFCGSPPVATDHSACL